MHALAGVQWLELFTYPADGEAGGILAIIIVASASQLMPVVLQGMMIFW
jgi:hypothetical protein